MNPDHPLHRIHPKIRKECYKIEQPIENNTKTQVWELTYVSAGTLVSPCSLEVMESENFNNKMITHALKVIRIYIQGPRQHGFVGS